MKTGRVAGLTLAGLALGIAFALHSSADDTAKTAKPGDVTVARIAEEASEGNNWLLNGRTFDGKHFSPLQQITDKNIGALGLAWALDIESGMGVVSEPIVVDGVIYVSAPLSIVYAVEAVSGKVLWRFDPQVRLDQAINGSYSARVNAGVAVWNGKVYVGTGDCRLVAIDAATAKQFWEAQVCEPTQTGITGAPHVARGKILMGFNGSDDGVRGALVAYDAETGKEAWRFWTVPGDPSKPFETKALEMAAKTWGGKDWWKVGGGDVWNAITYDDATGLVIFGTAGVGVDYGEFRMIKATGDRLFGECIIAVNADTGEYVWHYQTGTEGIHSENNHILMADLVIDGEKRHVAMDGSQLVADELQLTHWLGVCPNDGPAYGFESRGGGRRRRRGALWTADRVGSREPIGALVGGRGNRDEWRGSFHGGQSGDSGARNGRICGVCRGHRDESLVH